MSSAVPGVVELADDAANRTRSRARIYRRTVLLLLVLAGLVIAGCSIGAQGSRPAGTASAQQLPQELPTNLAAAIAEVRALHNTLDRTAWPDYQQTLIGQKYTDQSGRVISYDWRPERNLYLLQLDVDAPSTSAPRADVQLQVTPDEAYMLKFEQPVRFGGEIAALNCGQLDCLLELSNASYSVDQVAQAAASTATAAVRPTAPPATTPSASPTGTAVTSVMLDYWTISLNHAEARSCLLPASKAAQPATGPYVLVWLDARNMDTVSRSLQRDFSITLRSADGHIAPDLGSTATGADLGAALLAAENAVSGHDDVRADAVARPLLVFALPGPGALQLVLGAVTPGHQSSAIDLGPADKLPPGDSTGCPVAAAATTVTPNSASPTATATLTTPPLPTIQPTMTPIPSQQIKAALQKGLVASPYSANNCKYGWELLASGRYNVGVSCEASGESPAKAAAWIAFSFHQAAWTSDAPIGALRVRVFASGKAGTQANPLVEAMVGYNVIQRRSGWYFTSPDAFANFLNANASLSADKESAAWYNVHGN